MFFLNALSTYAKPELLMAIRTFKDEHLATLVAGVIKRHVVVTLGTTDFLHGRKGNRVGGVRVSSPSCWQTPGLFGAGRRLHYRLQSRRRSL